MPSGWKFPVMVAAAGYRAAMRHGNCGETFSTCVQYLPPPLIGSVRAAELAQEFPAAPYLGRHVRFSAWLRMQGPTDGYVHVRMRVFYPGGKSELFDSAAQPVVSAVWQRRDVFGSVGPNATSIAIWARYVPGGDAWVAAPSFGIVDSVPPVEDDFSVRVLIRAFADARNAHDGNAVAALYSEEGEYQGKRGTGVKGRPAIANVWNNVPAGEVSRTVPVGGFSSDERGGGASGWRVSGTASRDVSGDPGEGRTLVDPLAPDAGLKVDLSSTWRIAVLSLAVWSLGAQEEGEARFGTTVVIPSGLRGGIYFLREGTDRLPNFDKMEPVGTIYTSALNIPPSNFREGFPGVTKRSEWFAINYTGRFWIENPGKYGFGLISDDGSRLYIDGKQLLNNDGLHRVEGAGGWIKLAGGIHHIRVSYFQGPCYNFTDPCLALQLVIQRPGEKTSRIFSTEEYKPPANPADWKYGDPSQIPADPDAGRRKLKDVLKEKR